MARGDGYIKISRQLEEWEHFNNLALTGFWIHLLLRASWKQTTKLKPGELFLTHGGIADECGISRSTAYRYLKKLRESGEIVTSVEHGNMTKVRIVNWTKYQQMQEVYQFDTPSDTGADTPPDTPSDTGADTPQGNPILINKKKNKEQRIKKEVVGAFAPPTPQQVEEYGKEIGYEIDAGYFCDYYAERGWARNNGTPIEDWKATIRNWQRKDKKKGENEKENASTGGVTQKQHFRFKQKPDWLDDDE